MRRAAALLAVLCLLAGCGAQAPPAPAGDVSPGIQRPEGYAGSLLDGAARTAYGRMCGAADDWRVDEEILFDPPVGADALEAAWKAVQLDRPEFYWARCGFPSGGMADRFTLTLAPGLTLAQARERQRRINEAAGSLLDGIGGEAPDAAAAVHDALLRGISYTEGAQGRDAGNLYGGLVLGEGVCGAYSRSYQYLMQRMGVPCAYLSGTSVRGIPHSWNAVELADGWYYVDAAWDDLPDEKGCLYHDYLLVTGEEMALEHFPEPGQYRVPPQGESDRYNYYRRRGYCADVSDPDPVGAMAAGFARQLADQPLPAAKRPVFLEIKVFGEYGAFTAWRERYNREIFAVLRAISARLSEAGAPVEIDTTGYIEFNYNDNTQVLTLYPNASALAAQPERSARDV